MTVVVSLPEYPLLMVVKGPVKEVAFSEVGVSIITVPTESLSEGGNVTVVGIMPEYPL